MSGRTVYSLLEEAAAAYGDQPALHQPVTQREGGKAAPQFRSLSWVEYKTAAEEVAAGLHELGVRRGSLVGLDAETSLDFYLADLGVMTAGGVAAALYTSYPAPDHVRTLRQLEPVAVFVENPKMLGTLLSAADPPLDVRWILLSGESEPAMTFEGLRSLGREALRRDGTLLDRITGAVQPGDGAILYLTSGATGEPKMGLVTHGALVANVDMGPKVADIGPQDRSIAFLPSAHITQRVAMELLPIRVGMPVWFSEGLSRLPAELKEVKPTFFVAPPRVWERMHASIRTEINKKNALVRRLFFGALGVGLEISRRQQAGLTAPAWMQRTWKMADRAVFSTIRARLGGELRLAVSGAAPLGKDLADFYAAIGLPIHEGYGLTEGGIVALNPVGRVKPGSIGKPLPGVEMKLANDGELLIHSPTLFAGYHRDAGSTQAVLRDGWLHTGDIAEFDAAGYVFITGRKKEVIVASNGKKIYPAMIESLFKMEPLVHHVLLVGDKLPYVAALFTVNPLVAGSLKGMEALRGQPAGQLAAAAPVQAEVKRLVARVNRQLAPFEQIRKFHLLERDFTIEDGELTPTMKVRRARVLENHRHAVAALYGSREDALGE